MPAHSEQKVLPWSPDQLCALVADVERYPDFIPWCMAARIRKRQGDTFWADLVIGFRFFRERFTSRVSLVPGREIRTVYTEGPFRRMQSCWTFSPHEGGRCRIEFHIDFEFRSRLLQQTVGMLFHEAVRRMVAAFEARARELYGPGIPETA